MMSMGPLAATMDALAMCAAVCRGCPRCLPTDGAQEVVYPVGVYRYDHYIGYLYNP